MEEKKQGKSRKKRVLRAWLYGMVILLSMVIVTALLLELPWVQSMAARKVSKWVTEKTGDTLTIGSVDIDLFKGITINHLELSDRRGKPMIRFNKMKATPSYFKLLAGNFFIHKVSFDSVDFRLIEYKNSPNYAFILFIDKLSTGSATSSPGSFKLRIQQIHMSHLHFQLKNENNLTPGYPENTMNYDNIVVSNAGLSAKNFRMVGDSLAFRLENLTAHEKSGLFLRKMSSNMIISGKLFSFQNTILETNHSHLNLDYSMHARGWKDYSHFIDSVRLRAVFRKTRLAMSDIGYFAHVMSKMTNNLLLTGGEVTGPISRLKGKNLDIFFGKNTFFKGNVSVTGLPDFYSSVFVAGIQRFTTSVSDLKRFAIPQSDPHIPVPGTFYNGEKFTVSGTFNGSYYRFKTALKIKTNDSGNLQLSTIFKADTARIRYLKAEISAHRFPLERFAGKTWPLGRAGFRASVLVRDSLQKQKATLKLEGGLLTVKGYPYQAVKYHGNFWDDTLNSNLTIADPHLRLKAGGYTVTGNKPCFHLTAELGRADLKALHLWEQKDFHLSGQAKITFTGLHPDSLTGRLSMKNVVAGFGKDRYAVGPVLFKKQLLLSGGQSLIFHSGLLNFEAGGHFSFESMAQGVQQLVAKFLPGYAKTAKSAVAPLHNDTLHLSLLLKKPEFIGEHFIYGLNISPNTSLTASLNFGNGTVAARGYARKLVYQGAEALDNHLNIATQKGHLLAALQTRHLILRDSTQTDKTVFGLDSLRLKTNAGNDSINFGIYWDNADTVWVNKGVLEGLYVQKNNFRRFSISKSKVYVNDTLWEIDPGNKILYRDSTWKFKHLIIHGGLSQIAFRGSLPKHNGDSLTASFRSWNLSNLDLLWEMMGFDIDGIMNGSIKVTRMNNRNARIADLSVKHFALNHTFLGDARILSTWNTTNNSAFIKAQVIRKGNAGRAKVIGLSGFYYPYRDTASLDLSLDFNRLKLKAINPFFNEYVSHLEGRAQGHMTLKGSVKNPDLQGYIDINRASLVVNYLNTKYSFHQRVYFNKDKIDLGRFLLYDTLGNQAVLQGEIYHHYFRDMRLNFNISTKKLLFFNTTRHMNSTYYGTAIASGNVKITGPVNDIKMEITAKTTKGTSVILPLDYSAEVPDKDYIIFKPPPVDSSKLKPEETVLKLPEQEPSKYDISLNLNVQPSADLKIYLPSGMGDIQSNGNGILHLNVNSTGDLKLSGDYVVDRGEFNFSLGNVVKKHFELVKGGRISWAGNPYQATVYLKGLYKLKANLSSLGIVIDSAADYKNRTQVNCYVIMSHDLFNPDITFQIHFPELDPDMQRMVYAQLDTTNTAVMNQQMISLLVLGSFSFSNASSISWSTSYYTILSNQLSSMLSKISKDFDIGVNYKPGDALTKQEFDVALSTQLFDDRLIINGNFGMTYDKQNRSANNIVGDVDIKYKLTKDGRWMLKAYNHSNINSWYYYSNYDKVSPYTQGVGIVYRKEFNRLADLFRKKKKHTKTGKGGKK